MNVSENVIDLKENEKRLIEIVVGEVHEAGQENVREKGIEIEIVKGIVTEKGIEIVWKGTAVVQGVVIEKGSIALVGK